MRMCAGGRRLTIESATASVKYKNACSPERGSVPQLGEVSVPITSSGTESPGWRVWSGVDDGEFPTSSLRLLLKHCSKWRASIHVLSRSNVRMNTSL
ncbi:hypothetical protein NDU88_002085 [Pleurodeles waltl]|uniref:Uncharacterized protein n=1 Tax=Pleurodeles waltl TaxID=8319 RepID=A0AAV7UWL6_PLEWA|nr:hypothetical protein NDU88_002085 [Pleurodeles waltl]